MSLERYRLAMEVTSRCLLLAVMDTVLAQRLGVPKIFINEESYYYGILLYSLWWILNLTGMEIKERREFCILTTT